MTNEEAFKIGENIAVSPGKVIYQNELMQLIQYAPTTEQVYKRPLLLVPPWINKFYILDLKPKNSFIKFAVDQGYTVFVISWANPGPSLGAQDLRELSGRGAAGRAGRHRTGDRRARGHGDRLLPRRHAHRLHAGLDGRARRRRIKAATFLTTMTDFAEPGDLGVFIDDEQLDIDRAPHAGRRAISRPSTCSRCST